jgi:hypothetical protein
MNVIGHHHRGQQLDSPFLLSPSMRQYNVERFSGETRGPPVQNYEENYIGFLEMGGRRRYWYLKGVEALGGHSGNFSSFWILVCDERTFLGTPG